MLDRVKYRPDGGIPEFCDECDIQKGSYHKLGCSKEYIDCGKHQYMVECNCNAHQDEPV